LVWKHHWIDNMPHGDQLQIKQKLISYFCFDSVLMLQNQSASSNHPQMYAKLNSWWAMKHYVPAVALKINDTDKKKKKGEMNNSPANKK